MHFHFPFTAVETLWTLTFAAQLVLLVVLIGRERIRRFPLFTASIVVLSLRVLTARMLYHRLPDLTYQAILISLADLDVIVGLLLLVELARRAFGAAKRTLWIVYPLGLLVVGAAVLRFWGAWPDWKTMTGNSRIAVLLFMQLAAQKGELLAAVIGILLGMLVVLFGRSYGAGWRSHTQRIVIGLSTAAIGQLSVQAIWQIIVAHTVPKTRDQYEHVLDLHDKILNANAAIYLAVLIWWIVSLWMDEPGATKSAAATPADVPAGKSDPEPAAASGEGLAEASAANSAHAADAPQP